VFTLNNPTAEEKYEILEWAPDEHRVKYFVAGDEVGVGGRSCV
jgi:hypothetical protein